MKRKSGFINFVLCFAIMLCMSNFLIPTQANAQKSIISETDNDIVDAIAPDVTQLTNAAEVNIVFDASKQGLTIPNFASHIISNDYFDEWTTNAERYPNTQLKNSMPFVRYVEMTAATGGNTERDLFKNPSDRTVLNDYDFSTLIRACRNIKSNGLIPYIDLGTVPSKLSSNPAKNAFGLNHMPPSDYNQYYKYMTALLTALKKEFGAEELLKWKWKVITEYEGPWFYATKNPNDDPNATMIAYFKLYDYTVDALQTVIGPNVYVGAHSETVDQGVWDECAFIQHCASGVNYKTGKIGTRLAFLAMSYYEPWPSEMCASKIVQTVYTLRSKANSVGLTNIVSPALMNAGYYGLC